MSNPHSTMKCPLQDRAFFCRHWVFIKIKQYIELRKRQLQTAPVEGVEGVDVGDSAAGGGGVLLTGQAGAGKTAISCQLSQPFEPDGLQMELHSRVVATHFCQRFDAASQEVATFIRSLAEQLAAHPRVPGEFRRRFKERDTALHAWLEPKRCLLQPLEALYHAIVEPLLECNAPVQEPLLIVIDSVHESALGSGTLPTTDWLSTAPLAQLVAQMSSVLPKWLIVVATCRGNCRLSDHLFASFRKINLDDLRRSYAVNDIQQYILTRLDAEAAVRAQLDMETAEMLNQLHIKSAGCVLYLQTVLDGVRDGFIRLREINNIPSTLQGLYLWLCQRLFANNNIFPAVRLLLEILLASRRPLTIRELYQVAKSSKSGLSKGVFAESLRHMGPLLLEYEPAPGQVDEQLEQSEDVVRCLSSGSTILIFHPSFEEWLLDVKYCTRRYLCQPSNGHAALAMNYASAGPQLRAEQIVCFAYHLSRCTSIKNHDQFLAQSGAPVQHLVLDCPVIDQETTRLLLDAGADFVNLNTSDSDESLHALRTIDEQTEMEHKQTQSGSSGSAQADSLIDDFPMDSDDRCALHDAAAAGDLKSVSRLLASGVYVDAEDPRGDTALCLAARAGLSPIVDTLAQAGACLDHLGHEQWTALRAAAFAAHIDTVNVLLRHGASVDHCGSDNRRALRAAAWAGHLEVVELLLASGAEVDARDDQQRTALMTSAYMAHSHIVHILLAHGALVDACDCDGRSALHLAAIAAPPKHSQPHLAVLTQLIQFNANINLRDKLGRTALFTAAIENLSSVCSQLIQSGADLEMCDELHNSPLSAAAACGHSTLVKELIEAGASVDCMDGDGRTALTVAAAQGHVSVVQVLLDIELDELHADHNGWLPLHHAASNGHLACCQVLAEHNTQSVHAPDKEARTALLLAAQEGHSHVCTCLIQAGALVDTASHLGCTAVRVAALQGHGDLVRMLVQQAHADIDALDVDGLSTLLVCVSAGDLCMVQVLLACRANVQATDTHSRTALHLAAALGHTHILLALLAHGAHIDALDADGRTALMTALWANEFECARTLLCQGAAVNSACKQGGTALSIAAQLGNLRAVRLLLSHQADILHKDIYARTPEMVALIAGHTQLAALLSATSTNSPLPSSATNVPGNSPRLRSGCSPRTPRHGVHSTTTVSPHDSGASTSGVSAGDSSPPCIWSQHDQGAGTSRSDQSSTLSSVCISPEQTFAKQLKKRSSSRPFSGIFNIPPPPADTSPGLAGPSDSVNRLSLSGQPINVYDGPLSTSSSTCVVNSSKRRSNIVTNPNMRRSTSRSSSTSTGLAVSPSLTRSIRCSATTNRELQKATDELEQFLLSTATETSVV